MKIPTTAAPPARSPTTSKRDIPIDSGYSLANMDSPGLDAKAYTTTSTAAMRRRRRERQEGRGRHYRATCGGALIGNCCSQYDFCGSTSAYCEAGCQSGFGDCNRFLSVAATAASNSGPTATSPPERRGDGRCRNSHQRVCPRHGHLQLVLAAAIQEKERQKQQKRQTIERQIQMARHSDDASDGTTAERQRPYASADAPRAVGLPAPTKAYHAGALRPSRSASTRSSKRWPRQSAIFELQGGKKPYEYGRSPPVELYGSLKEEKD